MLADTLRSLNCANDLTRLFTDLGYTAANEPFQDHWRIVARWRGFLVIGARVGCARDEARAMARRLSAAARPTLVAALGPTRELALTAPRFGAAGCHRLLIVGLDHPGRFALQQLQALRPNGTSNTLAHALRVAECLASEQVGERFFASFRMLLQRMAATLDPAMPEADRIMTTLLALTRVLFLYFVQAKGWLDGRSDYLRDRFDAALARRRHFHRSVLHPLIFGTLNRPASERTVGASLGNIPYLNGGLFEPHPVERRHGPAVFSNASWRDAFDELFEKFRFCVREADEADAIAPDMLGRVFEGVMATGERHQTGTFYTPEKLVRELVEVTVATALTSHGGLTAHLARQVARGEPVPVATRGTARQTLRSFRLLDPAVGSGAFLLGALDCLTNARLALSRQRTPEARLEMRRRVMRENLFGVDVSPIAVRLAELRLWLAVVADDPAQNPARIVPLPNLDGIVRQGDSLLDPVGSARALGLSGTWPRDLMRDVRAARDALFEARGALRATAERTLRTAQQRLAQSMLAVAERQTRQAVRELAAMAQGRDLFGRRSGLTEPQERRRRKLRQHLEWLRSTRAKIADGLIPFFAFEVQRPEVIASGGFSAVVGNPPWVRAERLTPNQREALKARFRWWRPGSGPGFSHLPDLSVAFLERALELTAPGGAIGLLMPSKLGSAGYGSTARESLVRETTVTYLHRVPDAEASKFGATTYPLAVVAKKQVPPSHHRIRLGLGDAPHLTQRNLEGPGPWILLADRSRHLITRFLESGMQLGQIVHPALGLKTGADRVFVGSLLRHDGALSIVRFGSADVRVERAAVRWTLRGRDVHWFSAQPKRVIVWGYDELGQIRTVLPPKAATYLATHRRRLEARADYRTGPPWTLFRVRPATQSYRVVWADIARRPTAVLLEATTFPDAVPLNTCYVASIPTRETALVVAAAINTTWTRVAVRALADEARGGYRRHNATVMHRVPIPPVGPARSAVVELSARLHAGACVDQDELDSVVADALALPHRVRRGLADLANDPG